MAVCITHKYLCFIYVPGKRMIEGLNKHNHMKPVSMNICTTPKICKFELNECLLAAYYVGELRIKHSYLYLGRLLTASSSNPLFSFKSGTSWQAPGNTDQAISFCGFMCLSFCRKDIVVLTSWKLGIPNTYTYLHCNQCVIPQQYPKNMENSAFWLGKLFKMTEIPDWAISQGNFIQSNFITFFFMRLFNF